MSVVELEDVRKSYGDKVALEGLSVRVERGAVFGLLGPNGAGKTTALRIIMDIVRADQGRVLLFGRPLARELLDRVGYLPEERGLYTKHRVLDVMTYLGALRGLRDGEVRARARLWLDRVGLRDVEQLPVEKLSKGMSQKVQIAATLQAEPEICILDEPFSGLDPVNGALIRSLIQSLRSSGQTVILSTHQMAMVETLCDSVALLSRGKLVESGTMAEVRRRHTAPEVRVQHTGPLPDVEGVAARETLADGCLRLTLTDEASRVLGRLIHAGAQITRFEPALASMEDIFIRVVGDEEMPR
ncbi:MAG: ATP-binding cassette domain-containing protein [Polyangiaceae bacterium]|nr:ATP-binding cassette domain-containing protein [Polyangiaceae bacterium]